MASSPVARSGPFPTDACPTALAHACAHPTPRLAASSPPCWRASPVHAAAIDIGQVLLDARHRWLKPVEVCNILKNFKQYEFQLNGEPPVKPPSKYLPSWRLGLCAKPCFHPPSRLPGPLAPPPCSLSPFIASFSSRFIQEKLQMAAFSASE